MQSCHVKSGEDEKFCSKHNCEKEERQRTNAGFGQVGSTTFYVCPECEKERFYSSKGVWSCILKQAGEQKVLSETMMMNGGICIIGSIRLPERR